MITTAMRDRILELIMIGRYTKLEIMDQLDIHLMQLDMHIYDLKSMGKFIVCDPETGVLWG